MTLAKWANALIIGASFLSVPAVARDQNQINVATGTAGGIEIGYDRGSLAYEALMQRRDKVALEILSREKTDLRDDPARLINLGHAYLRLGNATKARAAFIAAKKAEDVDLVLSNGREINSRKVAILALKQLDGKSAKSK